MKIAVVIPTRERPALCAAVLTAFDQTASGKHDVRFIVRCDDDVPETAERLAELCLPNLTVISQPPPVTVGEKVNEAARSAPDADVVVQLCDDVFPLAQHWDIAISTVMARYEPAAFCWNELNQPGNTTFPVLTRKWVQAVGRIWPEHFPFWFADTWISEVHELAFGQTMPIIQDMALGGRRGTTGACRDLSFWFKFFAFTRTERLAEAGKIRQAFGVTDTSFETALLEDMAKRDARQQSRCAGYERIYNDGRKPSEQYLECYRRASALMAQGVAA